MRTRVWAPVAAFLFAAVFVAGVASAAGPSEKRGKWLFRYACKGCHIKKGQAKDLDPTMKTQAQWTRAFKKDDTVEKMLPRVAERTGKALTPEEVADLEAYLRAHAADSEQPANCGLK